MLELLPVLTSESVQKLKRSIVKNPDFIEMDLDVLAGELSLTFVPSGYKIDTTIQLLIPEGFAQEQNKDNDNSSSFLKILPALTPANATDERLWVTLSFGKFNLYLRERWPYRQSKEDKLATHIHNHWFAAGVRGRMRDNGISRLWWMGFIASKVPGLTTEQVYEILFANSEYRSSLLERNSSCNSLVVLSSILKITQNAQSKGVKFNRECHRDFMKEVNLIGGHKNLAAIERDSLIEILTPIYESSYQKNPQ